MRLLLTSLITLYCLGISAEVPAADKLAGPKHTAEYTVTVVPYYSPEKIRTTFTPFIDYLRKATGLPWELKLYPDHASLLEERLHRSAS